MNFGLILALTVVGQASSTGWQASDWPKSEVTPSQYTAGTSEVSPSAAARYGTPQYAQPVTQPQSNYDYSGQTRWPAAQPTPQPAATQPTSQFTNQQQYNAANSQPTWPNQYSQPRTADTRSTATGNTYGTQPTGRRQESPPTVQQPSSYWNQQPAASREPQLLAPQNTTAAQQQYWQQPATQAATQQFLADSKAALAAEYQAQVDDRWSFYSDFYRQPNPQLPTITAQQPTQSQYQNQSGAAVVNQPHASAANPYGNNYSQPNNQSSQLTHSQQTQTQPKTSQPNYNQPTYSQPTYNQQQSGSGINVAQQPSGWPNNVYPPQSQPSNPVGSGTATIADNRGSMTLQPPLNSTLPAGGDIRNGQYSGVQQPDFAPTPRYDNGQTAWNNDNAGNVGKSGWDNGGNSGNSNRNEPRPTTVSGQDNGGGVGQPRVDSTVTVNPPPATANTGFKSNFPALPSNITTSAPKSNLLSSLTPKSSPSSQNNQPLGSGKSGSGLFASASLGQTGKDAEEDHDHAGDGEQPWGVLVASLLGLFFSVGANLYLGWIAFESHFRYRRLLIEGDDDDRDSRRRD